MITHRTKVFAAVAVFVLLVAAVPALADEPTADASPILALVGVDVLPMTGTGSFAVLRDQTVLVQGDRIAAIGPRAAIAVPDGAQVVDGQGGTLIPGLADLHVHLEYFDEPSVLRLFLAHGVTTVRNMDGRPRIARWRDQVAAGELVGPALHTAGPLLDGDPPVLPDNLVVATAEAAREVVAAQAGQGYDFVKVYSRLSGPAYRAVLDEAAQRQLPVAGHLPGGVELDEALTLGQRSLEHLSALSDAVEVDRDGGWHWASLSLGLPLDDDRVAATAHKLARSGTWLVPTMIQAERAVASEETLETWLAAPEMAFVPPDGLALWEARVRGTAERLDADDWRLVEAGHGQRRRVLAALHDAGAKLLAGTDTPNPFVVPGHSLLEELELWVEAGIPPLDALAAATREAARFLGEDGEWGSIAVGQRADLLLLAGDPSEDIAHLYDQIGVVVRGRWWTREKLLTPPGSKDDESR